MSFTFDLFKSKSNQMKHGIDFAEAQKIWRDANRIEFPVPFRSEDRSIVVGKIDDTYWTAVVTRRDNMIRIISVRRSRTDEKEIYNS